MIPIQTPQHNRARIIVAGKLNGRVNGRRRNQREDEYSFIYLVRILPNVKGNGITQSESVRKRRKMTREINYSTFGADFDCNGLPDWPVNVG